MKRGKYFGKVCATKDLPSTPDEFHFWLSSGQAVQIGDIVVAETEQERAYGLVTDMKFYTDAESAFTEYISHDFGDPHVEAPTQRSELHLATAEVIGRESGRTQPTMGGLVRLAQADEIKKAYGMDQIEDPILYGIIRNGRDILAPALLSRKFLLGPEAAHVNICGATGLATKTSTAMFLIKSILSQAKKEGSKIATVAFNVKSEDLLYLERNSNRTDEILEALPQDERDKFKILNDYGVDKGFNSEDLRYFAPSKKFDVSKPNSLRQDGVETFYWALNDVINPERAIQLANLLDPADIDDRSYGVLAEIEKVGSEKSGKALPI